MRSTIHMPFHLLAIAGVLLQSQLPGQAALGQPAAIELVGSPEIVFDWTHDRCQLDDIPDLPARAFRAADGTVNLISSHHRTLRMTGSSLDTVARDCAVVMNSQEDPDFDDHAYHEWLTATYTLDGQTIYGLVHNEWYAFLVDPKCDPAQRIDGWVNSITFVRSTDSGASYTHPAEYLVLVPSTPWDVSFPCEPGNYTRYGAFSPSNIIKGEDGFYYALYKSERDPPGTTDWGTCLMRTADLALASGWEVWTINGWDSSPTAVGVPIARDRLEKMHESLTYNTYLEAYVLFGYRWWGAPEGEGVYFSVSTNLFDWSVPVKVLPEAHIYPSMLDPGSAGRNFEFTGQEPYLYYVRWYKDEENPSWNRDLLRQKVRFRKLAPVPPTNLKVT